MNQFINILERRFDKWAIPGIIRCLAIFFVAVFILGALRPEMAANLDFDLEKIRNGEYWRILSFIFAPEVVEVNTLSVLFLFFGTMLMFLFSDALESQWGTFRTNLYVLTGYLGALAANFLGSVALGIPLSMSGIYLALSIFFAFATYHPQFKLMIMFCIPCPVWILACLSGGMLVIEALGHPTRGLLVALSLSNYLAVAVPMRFSQAKRNRSSMRRRQSFRATRSGAAEPFHKCHHCGATDQSHPQLDFRVAKDGNDYCSEHIPQ